jgi:hypothetical protein
VVNEPAISPELEPSRTVTGAGYTPATLGRKQRRRTIRQARAAQRRARQASLQARRADREASQAEQSATTYLPAGGEQGPAALRTYRRLRVPAHRATSNVLAGAYPFLADRGLGSDGTLIGHDAWSGAAFTFDPWILYQRQVITNPNVLLAGIIGRGKSTLAKSIATRSIAFGKKIYVPGDPKGEWTVVANAVGGQAIQLGGTANTRLNPLDEGGAIALSDDQHRAETTRRRRNLLGSLTETALGRPLSPVEHTALDAALAAVIADTTTPTLPAVVDTLFTPRSGGVGSTAGQLRDDGRHIAHALSRLVHGDLAGLFDGPSTTPFDPHLPMISLDLSNIAGSDTLISLVMSCASAWMEAALSDPGGGQRWVIYDEAWRLLRQPSLVARMQAQWKLSRSLGIANLMVIHRISDLGAVGDADSQTRNIALGLLADCSTKIVYGHERGEAAKAGNGLGLTTTEIAQLPELQRGEGIWKIGERSFLIRHSCTTGELDLFDTDDRMIRNHRGFPESGAENAGIEK